MRAISLIALLVPLLATTLFSTPALAEEDGVIVPFSKFGACGVNCGDLYAVQGKCSHPTVDKNCFCSDPKLAGLTQSGPWAVCCVNTDAGEDITPIKTWFAQYCGKVAAAPGTPTTAAAGAKTSTTGTSTGTAAAGAKTSTTGTSTGTAAAQTSGESEAKKKQNQTWIEGHYGYLIMAVVLTIAIAGSWVAACFFRKRYLAKKSMNYELRPPHQQWVGASDNTNPFGGDGGANPYGQYGEESKKKTRWIVGERT